MRLSRYLKCFPSPDHHDHHLLFSTKRFSLASIPNQVLLELENGTIPAEQSQALQRLGFLVEDTETEKEQMRGILDRGFAEGRNYRAVVVLNLDCNLRCDYCYEESFRHNQYMTEETAALVVEKLGERITKGQNVTVGFYGGEALLSLALLKRMAASLQEKANTSEGSFVFSLVTNGTLLKRKVVEELVPLGLKQARITVDGPPEIHNRQRPFVSGKGSFNAIVGNIREVSDLVTVNLGGNFRQDNYREFPRLLDHLLELGLTTKEIPMVQFSPVTAKAGIQEHTSDCTCINEPWITEATLYLRGEILRRGFRPQPHRITACMVELENHLIVNWDGALYKCLALMGWEGNSVGTLAEGIEDYRTSHALRTWQNDKCLECAYLPLCFGGCRFLNLTNGKKMSDLDCRREFLDATLGRIVLQDYEMSKKQKQ